MATSLAGLGHNPKELPLEYIRDQAKQQPVGHYLAYDENKFKKVN